MPEYLRSTCLDRARVALEQTGQHHCAAQMGLLQKAIDAAAELLVWDSHRPVEIVKDLVSAVQIIGLFEEDNDEIRL